MWALRALCLAGLGAALGGGSADQCSWRGSGLSQEAGSVEQLSLHCAEGSLEWLYPTGALRLRLAPRLPPATATTKGRSPQHVTACVKPSGTFRGAQLYLEREGVLELLLPEAPRPRVRCFSWLPWEKVALFLQATPHRDISRRIAAFRYELRGDWLAHPALPAASLTGEGACRPCNDTEILMAICTSDFVIRGSIRSVSNDVELQESIIGVPYVPSSPQQVANTLALLRGRSGKTVDLGSGDGRLVVEAYKQGLRPAVGYELNPWLWHLSNYRAWKAGYRGKVCFLKKDLWKVNLSDCYNVIVFLAPSVKPPLAAKLLAELPDEARVVAGRFPFPSWTPTTTHGQGLDQVWAYDMKEVRQAVQSHAEGSPV